MEATRELKNSFSAGVSSKDKILNQVEPGIHIRENYGYILVKTCSKEHTTMVGQWQRTAEDRDNKYTLDIKRRGNMLDTRVEAIDITRQRKQTTWATESNGYHSKIGKHNYMGNKA